MISRCGSNYSTVTADVTVCSSDPAPTGTTLSFSIGASDPCVFVSTGGKSATATTNSTGEATVQVKADPAYNWGSASGNPYATITASANVYAGSGQGTAYVYVAQYSTNIQASANPASISAPSGSSTITFAATNPLNGGQAAPNVLLTIGTTAGTFSGKTNPFTQSTDSTGTVSVTLNLNPAQSATITATYTDTCLGATSVATQVVYRQTPWISSAGVGESCPLVDNLFPGDGLDIGIISSTDGHAYIFNGTSGAQEWESPDEIDPSGNNTLSCADIDNRGGLEITAPAYTNNVIYSYGYDSLSATTIKPLAGWPASTPVYSFHTAAAAISDMNLDGTSKIAAADWSCYVTGWNATGGSNRLWVQLTGSTDISIINSSVAVGDVNPASYNNHIPDAVAGAEDIIGNNPWSFAGDEWYDYSAEDTYNLSPGWQQLPTSTIANHFIECSPVIGQIDGDPGNSVAVGDVDGGMLIHLSTDQASNFWRRYQVAAQGESIQSSPIIVNLDTGGNSVVFGCNDGKVYAIHADGTPVSGWAGGILLNPGDPQPIQASPLYGNVVSGTTDPQVIVACGDGNVYALWKNGTNHSGGPIAAIWTCSQNTNDAITSTPTLCSIDGTHLDMIVGSPDGLYKIHFDGANGNPNITVNSNWTYWPWRTFHYNNARTGCSGLVPSTKVSASIIGRVTSQSTETPILGASVKVEWYNGSAWVIPAVYGRTNSRYPSGTNSVTTVGNYTDGSEINEGGYVINQLPPNTSYRLTISAQGYTTKQITVPVITGMVVQDVAL